MLLASRCACFNDMFCIVFLAGQGCSHGGSQAAKDGIIQTHPAKEETYIIKLS